jgi:aminomethyltransferase
MPWERATAVWDRLMNVGPAFGLRPAGLNALDIARLEAGLLLIDVDFHGSKKALVESQKYSPFEMSLDRLVKLDKAPFVGRGALVAEKARGPKRRIVGLLVSWPAVEKVYEEIGMPPQIASSASRAAVPVYRQGRQVGRATTTTWSPVLKQLIALATIDAPESAEGTEVELEITVEATRYRAPALVTKTPFFNPPRKTA